MTADARWPQHSWRRAGDLPFSSAPRQTLPLPFRLSHLWRTEVLAEHAQRATELACGELARRRGNPRLAGPSSGGRYGGRPSPWGPWGAITALAGRRGWRRRRPRPACGRRGASELFAQSCTIYIILTQRAIIRFRTMSTYQLPRYAVHYRHSRRHLTHVYSTRRDLMKA